MSFVSTGLSDFAQAQYEVMKLSKKKGPGAVSADKKPRFMVLAIDNKTELDSSGKKDEAVLVETVMTVADVKNEAKMKLDEEKAEYGDDKEKNEAIVKMENEVAHASFKKALESSGGDPRYGVLDFKGKLFFVMWSPDLPGKTKKKMKYSSAKQTVKNALNGIHYNIEANEVAEIQLNVFEKKIK